ncbi:thiamine phosphate synthase [Staphylococcus casei]|uniref:thiamine phosphate synthase n=1 Tax=Staphylococcus casei TaxID=201828 RepID=UPI0025704888|nr:thiamine phosphate synthase [Staphylococcus casei]WJE86533.1 thiamine phosphate synthase [Staphylococcus casei]
MRKLFVAITQYDYLSKQDAKHYQHIEQYIDYLIVRTPMPTAMLVSWITDLIQYGFPKDKVIIHDNVCVLRRCDLKAIHFRECDARVKRFKYNQPEIQVSMSTHSQMAIRYAEQLNLDFVLFGHVFETNSKAGKMPRTTAEIIEAVNSKIPVIALGGINQQTLKQLPKGFNGIAGISIFQRKSNTNIGRLKEVWIEYV